MIRCFRSGIRVYRYGRTRGRPDDAVVVADRITRGIVDIDRAAWLHDRVGIRARGRMIEAQDVPEFMREQRVAGATIRQRDLSAGAPPPTVPPPPASARSLSVRKTQTLLASECDARIASRSARSDPAVLRVLLSMVTGDASLNETPSLPQIVLLPVRRRDHDPPVGAASVASLRKTTG